METWRGFEESVPASWRERFHWNSLSDEMKATLGEFGLYMFGLGQHHDGYISEIKYDGRLIELDDGSRWEVDGSDADTADSWSSLDDVVVIDEKMYNLSEAPHVEVEEE